MHYCLKNLYMLSILMRKYTQMLSSCLILSLKGLYFIFPFFQSPFWLFSFHFWDQPYQNVQKKIAVTTEVNVTTEKHISVKPIL